MEAKRGRQVLIRRLVRSTPVETQAALRAALRRFGVRVDQATLSRDLTELGIRKHRGRYRRTDATNGTPRTLAPDPSAAVRGFRGCGPHLIVVRTETGQAQPVALWIDAQDEPSVVATLAGDDTIFLATPNRRSQAVALRRLEQWFGDRHER